MWASETFGTHTIQEIRHFVQNYGNNIWVLHGNASHYVSHTGFDIFASAVFTFLFNIERLQSYCTDSGGTWGQLINGFVETDWSANVFFTALS